MKDGWRLRGMVVAALAAGGLAACAPFVDPDGTQSLVVSTLTMGAGDRAMAALSRGDYAAAERHAQSALAANPKDPHALLVAGLAHQATGRVDTARQFYEVILTNRLEGRVSMPNESGVVAPRSVMEVARANMAAIDRQTGRDVARSAAQSGRPPGASAVNAPPFPVPDTMGDPLPSERPDVTVPPPGRITEAEANLAGRFRILNRLLEEGLITPEEHAARRAANVGALLPYSAKTRPAQALERPIPRDEAVIERLKALGVTLETRAISPREHADERTVILEALLPEKPRRTELPALPPRDMIEAAAAVGRVERLRAAGLLSADEAGRERSAIESALETGLAAARVSGSATGLRHGMPEAKAPNGASASGWGVRLDTSPKSEATARKAWEILKGRYPDQLGKLQPAYVKTELPGRGTRWAVIAGPLDRAASDRVCAAMKLKRQMCDPVPYKN